MIARDIFPDHPDKEVLSRSDEVSAPLTLEEWDAMWAQEQEFRAKHLHQHECGHDCTGSTCLIYSYIDSECLGCQRRRYGL